MVGTECRDNATEPCSGAKTTRSRVDAHLRSALERCDDDDAKYHIREALSLYNLE